MNNLVVLIPITLAMGVVGLLAFLWSLRTGQYSDLDGAAERVLFDDEDDERLLRAAERSVSQGPDKPPFDRSVPDVEMRRFQHAAGGPNATRG
ncbi:cbb3-type cytochrome oxidase assembly protein CcoS (plasmid) [Sinorhizobium terangae]|nr:cbb3-type cytochrome oxidase assembly protein CcoS [Sinorhizobium terangae]WFU51293.1 cbb3-type cytochrome oxidase assembly protein CcoS [Sinorhizobium terangae]